MDNFTLTQLNSRYLDQQNKAKGHYSRRKVKPVSGEDYHFHNILKGFAIAILGIFIVLLLFWAAARAEVNMDIPAIIQIESSGNSNAVSEDGCIGLMQISSVTYQEFKNFHKDDAFWQSTRKDCLYHPQINRDIGTWYINKRIPQMLSAYKIPDTVEHRLIAYNWGIGNLKKWYRAGKDYKKLPRETQKYIDKYKRLARGER